MNKKKRFKGMTLVEIVISIAVFAVVSLLLVTFGVAVNAQRRSANHVNKKVAVQGPIAEAQNEANALLVDDDYEIVVKKKDSDNAKVTIKGKLYSTRGYTIDEDGNQIPDPNADKANLQFIDVKNPTPAGTTAPSEPEPAT